MPLFCLKSSFDSSQLFPQYPVFIVMSGWSSMEEGVAQHKEIISLKVIDFQWKGNFIYNPLWSKTGPVTFWNVSVAKVSREA